MWKILMKTLMAKISRWWDYGDVSIFFIITCKFLSISTDFIIGIPIVITKLAINYDTLKRERKNLPIGRFIEFITS